MNSLSFPARPYFLNDPADPSTSAAVASTIEGFSRRSRRESKRLRNRGGSHAAVPLTHMNRKNKPAEKPKQKSNLKETTAMKTVITSNSSLLTILRSRSALILIALTLVAFVLVQRTQAVNPPPDGGYPGGNTAEGQGALLNLTSGTFNTAVGLLSLSGLKEGKFNTGLGAGTLLSNVAAENTATGAGALLSNTTGELNTANGAFALFSNTEGTSNTASGERVLFSNTVGSNNAATGANALGNNTVGSDNTADGASALVNNVTGNSNMANGASALGNNVGGNFNTANGANALLNNTTGNNNIALGFSAGDNLTTGDNNIDIGAEGVADESNTIRIGTNQRGTFIAGIRGATTANANAIPVLIDSVGQLGTLSSSRRFKKDIKPMNETSEAILALKPVTFHYKNDNSGTPQFGLIAEEVAEANPDLVMRDDHGEIYTVRYEAVNAMLLNEFLKENRKNEEQEKTIAELRSGMTALAATVKEQASQIQKVSAQLETSKPAPQVVNNL
jgi:Chaperone of endosialidase